jgi:hypothetical protein
MVPAWMVTVSVGWLVLVGIGIGAGLLLAAGVIRQPATNPHYFPGLEQGAILGLIPIAGAGAAWWFWRRGKPEMILASLLITAMAFIAGAASWGAAAMDPYKAPRGLVAVSQAWQTDHEVRIGCFHYYQPSLVFYCRREVTRLANEKEALDFLKKPLPVYLFVPAAVWQRLESKVQGPHRLLGRNVDLYRRFDVVVVTNQ